MISNLIKPLVITLFWLTLFVGMMPSVANATSLYELSAPTARNPHWVTDPTDVISAINKSQLSKTFTKLSQQTGDEVRMVVIRRTTMGYSVPEFTEKLFEKWFPTTAQQANQALLVIDTATNNSAIRTGSEVEDTVTKVIATSITEETVQAPLREGNRYNQALLDASERLVAVLSGGEDPGPPEISDRLNIERTYATAEETNDTSATVWVVVLLVLATVIPMVTYFFYVGFPGS